MARKLLLFDIGNTTIKVGLVSEQGRAHYCLSTDASRTSDDFGFSLLVLLSHAKVPPEGFEACVVSSVVPAVDPVVREAVLRYLGCPVFFVSRDIPVPLENHYANPREVGADRLVAAYAARRLYPASKSLVVIDFGTAVTFDCVSGNAYLGGLIFPGPQTALSALAGKAAKLPHIALETDAKIPEPSRDTVTSIRHGILFGFASMVEGLSAKLASGLDGPVMVLGTGGFASQISSLCASMNEVRPNLLLEGLELIYSVHHGK